MVWITEFLMSTNPELAGDFLLLKLCLAQHYYLDMMSIFQSPSVMLIFILNYTRFFSHIEIHNVNLGTAHPVGPLLIGTITSI